MDNNIEYDKNDTGKYICQRGEYYMEVVRRFVDASKIMSVIPLPEALRNRKLEVIVLPAEETVETVKKNAKIESLVDSLTGIIPDNGMSLADYRAERLGKYEIVD